MMRTVNPVDMYPSGSSVYELVAVRGCYLIVATGLYSGCTCVLWSGASALKAAIRWSEATGGESVVSMVEILSAGTEVA